MRWWALALGWLVASSLGLTACQPDLREGHYACRGNAECPSGWFCRDDQRCWSSAEDLRPDTGPRDTGIIDTGPRDAGELTDRGVFTDAAPNDGADTEVGTTDLGPRPDQGVMDVEPPDLGLDAGDSGCAANVGQACARNGFCDATYDCDGVCGGGTPLPTCQCGTPTCGGCIGGTCGVNSTCQNGTCACTTGNNTCDCDGRGSVDCDYCAPDDNIYGCQTDAYGCGRIFTTYEVCAPFACDPIDDLCFCSANEGDPCTVFDACFCGIEICILPGFVGCNGTCIPTIDCVDVCDQGVCLF